MRVSEVKIQSSEPLKLQIGGAKLEKILYVFYKGRFMEAFIITQDYNSLKDVVDLKFGDPTRHEDFGFGISSYEWSGNIATVRLVKFDKSAGLKIYSTQIYTQKEEDERRKKEEEARRKEEEKQKAAEEGLDDF